MKGITHIAVGTAAAVTILKPDNIKESLVGLSLAIVGSLISDIDCETSTASMVAIKVFNVLTTMLLFIGVSLYYLNMSFSIESIKNILSYEQLQLVSALLIFILFIIIGMFTRHRTFTHSVEGILIYSGCIFSIFGKNGCYFIIGMVLHIGVDIFNMKPVKIFIIIDKLLYFVASFMGKYSILGKFLRRINKRLSNGFCLYICHSSNAAANGILIFLGSGIVYSYLKDLIIPIVNQFF